MSDFESLLAAIPDNPDVAFLLADYLEDRDDPRCELLRLLYTLRTMKEVTTLRQQMEGRLRKLLRRGVAPVGHTLRNSINMTFVWIPPGTFLTGDQRANGSFVSGSLQCITLTKGFYLGRTPVTQGQWNAVMDGNPSRFRGDPGLPVESVSWYDCERFLNKLCRKENTQGYRLPTEAEWEHACRAGTTTNYYCGNSEREMATVAWCQDNSEGITQPVGQLRANPWGLYDMHGNVDEWCQDLATAGTYGLFDWQGRPSRSSDLIDPVGAIQGLDRGTRGGSWQDQAYKCRSASWWLHPKHTRMASLGFRVCLDVK
ncbi:MAG: formylglycine-generating enzyme family protein [Gemmataceae bacterium]